MSGLLANSYWTAGQVQASNRKADSMKKAPLDSFYHVDQWEFPFASPCSMQDLVFNTAAVGSACPLLFSPLQASPPLGVRSRRRLIMISFPSLCCLWTNGPMDAAETLCWDLQCD